MGAVGAVLPLLMEQAAGALVRVPGEEIDETLLQVARVCLGARSIDARPRVAIVAVAEPAGPAHNED